MLARQPDLVHLFRPGKLVVPVRKQPSDSREELCPLFFSEFCAERVDGDIDCPSVGFEGEYFVHDVRGGRTEGCAEGIKVLQVGFVHGIPNDLNVKVV